MDDLEEEMFFNIQPQVVKKLPETLKHKYHCDICQRDIKGKQNFDLHIKSKAHIKKANELESNR